MLGTKWAFQWHWSMELHAEELFEGTLREKVPLQNSKIAKKTLESVIRLVWTFGFLGIFVFVATPSDLHISGLAPESLLGWIRAGWAGWFFVCLCVSPLQWILYFRRYFYNVSSSTITIRKGIIAQKEVTLPFSQITDVYVDQDNFDVILGLYDVHISTATQESGTHAHIDGVSKRGAMLLKTLILKRITKQS